MRTQVVIIGAGPSGLLLSQLLHLAGVDCLVLERRDPEYVLSRIRAGVLEQGMVDMLERAGVSDRMRKEGLPHDGFTLSVADTRLRIDLKGLTGGKSVMVYGQTEVTRNLMDAHRARDGKVIYDASNVTPLDFDGPSPRVTYDKDGTTHEIACDFICGCDGFHGVSRASVLDGAITEYEKVYPFGWLGILSYVKPVDHELIYSNHPNGFALASMRSEKLSRYYIQVPIGTDINAWSDDAIWDELKIRLG
ncbi:MAG: 4-hydroxybenzoate 3-monooxygenase, partial [Roseibium sp.]